MNARNAVLDFQHLKRQVGIGQILSAYGLDTRLKRTGDTLRGPCPLHGGDNPTAFSVNLRRDLWRCFTGECGAGDVVELVRRIERCSYPQAARHLQRIAGTQTPPPLTVTTHPTTAPRTPAFRPFRRRIPLDPRVPFLQRDKGISITTAARFEAGRAERSAMLRGTVAVRLHDLHGRPLGYCGRRLDPETARRQGKWRFPAAFPKAEMLCNAHRALPARCSGIVVVECPWAVLRLAQAGVPGAVALLGTAISPVQQRWLAKAQNILLLLDGDTAGRSATTRIAAQLRRHTVVNAHRLTDSHEPEDLPDTELPELVRQHMPAATITATDPQPTKTTP